MSKKIRLKMFDCSYIALHYIVQMDVVDAEIGTELTHLTDIAPT